MASLFVGHAAQKSKLHNLQYDEGGNHMAETETEKVYHYSGLLSDARRHVINESIIQQKSVEIELLTGSIIRSSSPSITHSPL